MSILWWEKTVEYYFIQNYVDLNMFIAPLDGNHEKAGDAIFAHESSWVLIEFKRDKNSIRDEVNKFIDYPKAKEDLEPIGQHHLIIYGIEFKDEFDLKCQQYFSGYEVTIDRALSSGVEKNSFIDYLKKFVKYKKPSKNDSGGYGLVAGVSNDGTVTKCMKLSEFAESLKLEKTLQQKLKQQQANSYSGPSLGR